MVHKVIVSEFMDEEALKDFGPAFDVRYDPSLVDDPARLMQALGDASALIVRNRTRVDDAILSAAPALRVVGRLGVGLENIDLAACAARDVTVMPATGANTQSVVEYVIATMLVLRRKAFASTDSVAAGDWPRTALGAGGEVGGLTLGLIGYGAIAQAVAQVARALGMHIAAFDPFLDAADPAWQDVRSCAFDTLLETADVLSLHVPLTKGTAGLLDAAAIAKIKPGAILVNTARGGIVDAAALCDALRQGRLGGAALDVFDQEPLTDTAGAVFADCPNLILTPHIAGVTEDANARVSRVTVENVKRALGYS